MSSTTIGLVASIVLGIACVAAQGPLPGDVFVTRALQSLLGTAPSWASFLTGTAKPPLVWVTLAVGVGLAFLRGGVRSVAVPPVAFAVVYGLDLLLRALIFAPRPTADLVAVAAASPGSGLPSTFALVYGALFGAVLFGRGGAHVAARLAGLASVLLIVAGSCARIVLAGHWPSQLLASLLLALAVAGLVRDALDRLRGVLRS